MTCEEATRLLDENLPIRHEQYGRVQKIDVLQACQLAHLYTNLMVNQVLLVAPDVPSLYVREIAPKVHLITTDISSLFDTTDWNFAGANYDKL